MTNRVNEAIEQLKAEKKAERNNRNLSEDRAILLYQLRYMCRSSKLSKGRSLMKDIVIEYVGQHQGSANHEISKGLEIVSNDASGKCKDFFSWYILESLTGENKIEKQGTGQNAKYYPNPPTPKIS